MQQRKVVRCGWSYDPVARSISRDAWFVIDDGRVACRGEGNDRPRDLPVLDFGGSLVTPGLIDAHCHLTLAADGTSPEDTVPTSSPEFFAAVAVSNLLTAAANGVTTVCDLGSRGQHLLRLRDHLAHPTTLPKPGAPRDRTERRHAGIDASLLERFIAVRRAPLPQILAAGEPITPSGGHMDYFGGVADDEAEMVKVLRRQRAAGADLVKVVGNGGGTRYSRVWVPYYGARALARLAEEAHAYGQLITIHANHVDAIRAAVDAGFDGLEHATFLTGPGTAEVDEQLVDRIAERGIWVTPTPIATQRTIDVLEAQRSSLSTEERAYLDARSRHLEAGLAAIERLHRGGVRLALGTDAGWRLVRHDDVRAAMLLLSGAGLSLEEVFFASTLGAARARGCSGQAGSLAVGTRADFTVFAWPHAGAPDDVPKVVEATFIGGVEAFRRTPLT